VDDTQNLHIKTPAEVDLSIMAVTSFHNSYKPLCSFGPIKCHS